MNDFRKTCDFFAANLTLHYFFHKLSISKVAIVNDRLQMQFENNLRALTGLNLNWPLLFIFFFKLHITLIKLLS